MSESSASQLPSDPVADFFAYLKRVHLHAGQPSFRKLAGQVGYSYTTVHSAIRGPRMPRWDMLALVAEQLGADMVELKRLWTAAREASQRDSDTDGGTGQIPLHDRLDTVHRETLGLLARVRSIRAAPKIDPTGNIVVTERRRMHKGKINAVTFADSGAMATVGEDGILRIWKSAESLSPRISIEAHDGNAYGASFNGSGDLIATAGADRVVKVWAVNDGSLIYGPLEHDRSVRDVAFGLPEDSLVSVSSDGSARIWNPTTGEVIGQPLRRRTRPLLCVAVSTDSRRIAVGGADGIVELWDSASSDPPLQLSAHTDHVKGLSFNPIDGRLASSGMDRIMILWDTDTGKPIGEPLVGYDGTVYSSSFSPDGSLLVSGSYDGTVRIAMLTDNLVTNKSITEANSSIRSVAFSPDGATVVAVTTEGSMILCSSIRAEISGAELDGVIADLEHLVNLTRLSDGV